MFTQNSATGARVTVNLSVLVRDWRERYVPVLDVHVWMSCHVAFDGGIKLFGFISVLLFITSSVWAIDLGCSKILNLKKRCHFLWLFFFFLIRLVMLNTSGAAQWLQLCLTLCSCIDCSLPGSSVHGILQARMLEWGALPSSKGSSQPRDWTGVSALAGGFLATSTACEAWQC